jgi:hypothetical protein
MQNIIKLKSLYIFVLILTKAPNVFGDNNFYLQATTQIAATNFDYVSTSYYNSSIEGYYNFENSPFIIGGGFGQIYGTTDNLYTSNGGVYNSSFTVPYLNVFAGIMLRPLPKIRNITTFRVAQSISGQSNCNPSLGYACNPTNSSVNLFQLGFRNSTMYFFTSNIYAAFNAGMDINAFTFTPGFSINPDTKIANREYNNPGPNIGFSIGVNF